MATLIREVIIDPSNKRFDILIKNKKIERIGENLQTKAGKTIEGKGRVLLPGFVEGHIHLDKALIADRIPNKSGT